MLDTINSSLFNYHQTGLLVPVSISFHIPSFLGEIVTYVNLNLILFLLVLLVFLSFLTFVYYWNFMSSFSSLERRFFLLHLFSFFMVCLLFLLLVQKDVILASNFFFFSSALFVVLYVGQRKEMENSKDFYLLFMFLRRNSHSQSYVFFNFCISVFFGHNFSYF